MKSEGLFADQQEIKRRFTLAFRNETTLARSQGKLAYGQTQEDSREFWWSVFSQSVGEIGQPLSGVERAFESARHWFTRASAWAIDPNAVELLKECGKENIPVIAVSNWDLHLRPLLTECGLASLFAHLVISAEVGFEKPDPRIYEEAFGLYPSLPKDRFCMVGNDLTNDYERPISWDGLSTHSQDGVHAPNQGHFPLS